MNKVYAIAFHAELNDYNTFFSAECKAKEYLVAFAKIEKLVKALCLQEKPEELTEEEINKIWELGTWRNYSIEQIDLDAKFVPCPHKIKFLSKERVKYE